MIKEVKETRKILEIDATCKGREYKILLGNPNVKETCYVRPEDLFKLAEFFNYDEHKKLTIFKYLTGRIIAIKPTGENRATIGDVFDKVQIDCTIYYGDVYD